jgi:ferredoxin
MIVGEIKPLEEIIASIAEYRQILVAGCGSCVSVCLSGGEREVTMLAGELRCQSRYQGSAPTIVEDTILRQCELDLIKTYHALPAQTDAVLSLACGAGVQTMAEAFDPVPVIPALNTTFLGAAFEPGMWREMCHGCGDCLLSFTGGICPIARCSKSLLNGPCGGTNGQSCEVDPSIPCAWVQIIQRLSRRNKLHLLTEIRFSKDWRPAGAAGPRIRQRTGIAGSPGPKPE